MAGLAVLGNFLHLPLFFGVDLIFGSVAALVALAWLGPVAGIAAAVAGGLYTLVLWGHPYALVILVLEVAVVAFLLHRGWFLVLADATFWLVAGAPLVLALYTGPLGMDLSTAGLIALKQPVNGLINALLASFVLLALQAAVPFEHPGAPRQIRFRNLLFALFMALALIPGTLLVVTEARSFRQGLEWALAERMALAASLSTLRGEEKPRSGSPSAHLDDGLRVAIAAADSSDTVPTRAEPGHARAAQVSGLRIHLPSADALPAMVRWKRAVYSYTRPLPDGGRVRVTAPAAGLVERMRTDYRRQLGLLAGLALLAAAGAALLSRWLTGPLDRLNRLSARLPERTGTDGPLPAFPRSQIADFDTLIASVKDMAVALRDSLRESEKARSELESRVRERAAALERSNAELRRLAEISAHHLQEPVRRAVIYTQRLRRHPEDDAPEWQHLEEQLGWMSELVTDLQRYLAYLNREPQTVATELDSVVAEARAKLGTELDDAHLTTDPEPLPQVRADPALLTEVFRQLLANAARFRRVEAEPAVHITARAHPGAWEVAITDNGRGLDPEYAERIFRLFERLDPRQGPAGTGIGLTLAKRIVENHGGWIRAESDGPERGTTIRFSLPHPKTPENDTRGATP
ncbi:sensor histidine kinase [Thiohalorhabdus methylotrophus]|uniref:histidine kinase n=1 Tax=Thiohalorhabdus methylotrophus TaxID=3242694 RepID=A0ABV4TXG7_9GAMM